MINETIQRKLNEIEEKENVKILHAVESGSRAWGFASPDSDYDVRFIYLRDEKFYLRLDKTRDVIEWQLDDTLDINGWDFKKALTLLYKSNPTLFEWNASPIVYKTTDTWQEISSVINKYFVQKSGVFHYLSTATSNYREYLKGDTVRLKKYFYVLRPLLACEWIIDRGTPPPMLFSELASAYLVPSLKDEVDNLVAKKMQTSELGTGKRIDVINDYIDLEIERIYNIAQKLPDKHGNKWVELNELFLSVLKTKNR